MIGDGALPSNEGRGYVLRRILRRAVRFGKVLGIEKPFLYQLSPVVRDLMIDAYPELEENLEHVQNIIKMEEERFRETLNDGMKIVNEIIKKAKAEGNSEISGKLYFTIHMGSHRLNSRYCRRTWFNSDEAGFNQAMEEQRQRARSAQKDVKAWDLALQLVKTRRIGSSKFLGYENLEVASKIWDN